MNGLLFVAWIASGTIHVEGIKTGSLGNYDPAGVTARRACKAILKKRIEFPEAELFTIGVSGHGLCDWGCEYEVDAYPVVCAEEQPPTPPRHVVVVPKVTP